MKINAGCGGRYLPEYTNVDIQALPGKRPPDILSDLRHIPLETGCADEVMAIHVFEHFYRWQVDEVLAEWKRLLKPRTGRLVMEMPDIKKCCKNLLEGSFRAGKHPDQVSYWGIYGDPRSGDQWMNHRWGWHFGTVKPLLESHGFIDVIERETKWHPVGRYERDFRVEATRA